MPLTKLDTTAAHVRHGIKTGLAAVLAYALTQIFDLSFGYWAALSAVIVMQVNVADSIQMCWYRFSGTAVGAVIGIAAIVAFPETPFWTSVALFLSTGFCAFMTKYNAHYRMAAITVSIVLLASVGEPVRVPFALYRVLEIAVGVVCAFAVTISVWPLRAGHALRDRLEDQFDQCAFCLNHMVNAFLDRTAPLNPDIVDSLEAGAMQSRELYRKVLLHEQRLFGEDTADLGLKVDILYGCVEHLRMLLVSLDIRREEEPPLIMENDIRALTDALRENMKALGHGYEPSIATLESALAAADSHLLALREQGATRRLNMNRLMQYYSFYHGLHHLGESMLANLRRRLEISARARIL